MPVDEDSTTGRPKDISSATRATREQEQEQKLSEVDSSTRNSVQTHSQLPSDVNLFLKAEKVTSNEVRDEDVDMKPSSSGPCGSKESLTEPIISQTTKVSRPVVFEFL